MFVILNISITEREHETVEETFVSSLIAIIEYIILRDNP